MADFVGSDREVRRLGVVRVEARDLFVPPTVPPGAAASYLARGLAASEAGLAVLVDPSGRPIGWATTESEVKDLPTLNTAEAMPWLTTTTGRNQMRWRRRGSMA